MTKLHTCPICGKTFTTKAALKQHESVKHSAGAVPIGKVGGSNKTRSNKRNSRRRRGVSGMAGSAPGLREASTAFDSLGAAELVPKGNPAGAGTKSRPYFGLTTDYDKCHKFVMACEQLGCTRAGAVYALKNVHPNCDNIVEFQGIPDRAVGRIFPLEIRSIVELTSTGAKIWDFAVVSRWSPNLTCVTTTKLSDATVWGDFKGNETALSTDSLNSILKYRVGYGGMTVYLSAAANQTEGMAYCSTKTPEVGLQINSSGASDVQARKLWREDSGKWDQGDMFSSDPGFYMNQSFKGFYGRMIAGGETRKWINASDGTKTGPHSWTMQTPDGTEKLITPVPNMGGEEAPDMSNIYGLLKGLDPKAKVVVKTRIGYETVLKADSLATYGLRFSPDHDETAMELTSELMKGIASGVPSSENDLSGVLDSATDILFDVLSAAPNPIARGAGTIGRIIKGFFK